MIVIIDGSGPGGDAYDKEMAGSFCKQLAVLPNATYFRGPTKLAVSITVSEIVARAVPAAQALHDRKQPIYLAGYSRGGCTAIIVAQRLKALNKGIRVAGMFLFDAVDMQVAELGLSQNIPDNVDYVAHARTVRNLKFWINSPVKSRFYFYNTGRWLNGSGKHHEKSFLGSHGAAGGVPWPESEVSGDAACTIEVANWMSGHLAEHKIGIRLSASGPAAAPAKKK